MDPSGNQIALIVSGVGRTAEAAQGWIPGISSCGVVLFKALKLLQISILNFSILDSQ